MEQIELPEDPMNNNANLLPALRHGRGNLHQRAPASNRGRAAPAIQVPSTAAAVRIVPVLLGPDWSVTISGGRNKVQRRVRQGLDVEDLRRLNEQYDLIDFVR